MVFFEGVAEMADIFVPKHMGGFVYFAVGGQKFGRLIHFQPGDIGDIGLPGFPLEQGAEIGWIYIKVAGDYVQGKVVHNMVGNKLEHVLELEAGVGAG